MLIDGSPLRAPDRALETKTDLGAPATGVPASVLSDYIAPSPGRHFPHMLVATTLVAVLPLALSLSLRASGVISGWLSVGLAVVMSLAASTAGSAYWRKRGGHGEVLFSELLLWGWVRSWRQERELTNATRLLDLVNSAAGRTHEHDELSVERREHLLRQLAGALEGQDIYLNGHSRRVARHATMIARGMGLPNEQVARIRAAAAVHDVGKLRTPKAVLNKPGRLTDEEFDVIKRHPVDGAEIVAGLGDVELTRIVRHHHERLDGAGYPDGLRGEQIPVGARIIAVADTFDAITSARPYRDAAPHQKAIDILRKEAGTQLDPDAVRAFLAYYSGNRPTVLWGIITSSLRRVVSWLSGDPAAAATISAGKLTAATMATAAIGAAAGAAPVPVVHHPVRPLHAHTISARPSGVPSGPRRQSTLVVVPATPAVGAGPAAGAARAAKPAVAASAKTRRGATHRAAAKHGHGQAAAKSSKSRARGSHSSSSTGTGTPASTAPGQQGATGSPGTLTTQSAGNGTLKSAGTPAARHPAPANPAPASRSQGSNANGNAFGHTKPLGNGHGKGVAAGHVNPNPPPAPPARTSPAGNGAAHANPNANVPATVPSGAHGPGDGGSQSSAGSGGQGGETAHGNGNSQSNATSSAVPTPPAAGSQAGAPGPQGGAGGSQGGDAGGHSRGSGGDS